MRYQINGLFKFVEQDSFSDGCLPGTGHCVTVDASFRADTIPAVIAQAARFLGVGEDGIVRDACEEVGRVDFARTENDNGDELTPREVNEWKRGTLRAWYAVYTAHIEQVQRVSAQVPA